MSSWVLGCSEQCLAHSSYLYVFANIVAVTGCGPEMKCFMLG
jgi:hypothetical protein